MFDTRPPLKIKFATPSISNKAAKVVELSCDITNSMVSNVRKAGRFM
jgi:hypothetical protein